MGNGKASLMKTHEAKKASLMDQSIELEPKLVEDWTTHSNIR